MKKISKIFDNIENLKEEIKEENIDFNAPMLVRIITSENTRENAHKLAKDIKKLLPNSTIIGATSSMSVIHKGEQIDYATLIVIEQYAKLILSSRKIGFKDKSIKQLAKEVHEASTDISSLNCGVNILFPAAFWDGYKFVREFDALKPQVKLVGGMAGEMVHIGGDSYLFDENGVYDDSMLIFAATHEDEHHFLNVFTPHDVLSESVHEITKTDGHFVKEIDGQPAGQWILDYLNISEENVLHHDLIKSATDFQSTLDQVNNDYLTRFPILLEEDGTGWYSNYVRDENALSFYHANLTENIKFKMGYVTPIAAMNQTYELLSESYNTPIESIFAYTCVVQRMYLSNVAKWALAPFNQCDVCGMFMMGEIVFRNGKNEYHQGACVINGVSESEKYIMPELQALEKISLVEKDIDFIMKAIEKQSQTTKSGAKYVENLDKHRRLGSIESYFKDPHFNMPNMLQYKSDREIFKMDKICLVEIQTADATIAYAGQEAYDESCIEMMKELNEIYKDHPVFRLSRMYAFNYKCIVISCLDYVSNLDFIDYCKELHQKYGYAKSLCHDITTVSRFVVVLNQDSLVEEGMKYLFSNSDKMDTFVVCSSAEQTEDITNKELQTLDLINRAIKNNLVVPYYQGLHNNTTKTIDKYESLMRIKDIDGTLYTPYSFMDISKKYKLYSHISQLMVESVLNDFKDRKEGISLNLSINDIDSSVFREWLLEELGRFPNPQRVIIEVLESDDFKNLDVFFEFIKKVRKIGCKIAIDDFGSGYSTFTTVLQLEPDIIKIDGSIVNKVDSCNKSLMILDTIQYLTKKLGALTVAEFVENQSIQDILEKYEVSYSQGYHFSMPLPFEQLP